MSVTTPERIKLQLPILNEIAGKILSNTEGITWVDLTELQVNELMGGQ